MPAIRTEDVAVGTARLARARGDLGVQATKGELLVQVLLHVAGNQEAGALAVGDLLRDLGGLLAAALLARADTVPLLVELTVRGGIDLNDGALDQSLGADKFVVRGVVDDVKDARLHRGSLRRPRVGARVQTQRTALDVATTDTDVLHQGERGSKQTSGVVIDVRLRVDQ